MKRPTIADLANASGVSVSTVNRILSGKGGVRPETIQLVRDTAAKINFYGRGIIESRQMDAVPELRLGFLLQQESREVYRVFGEHITRAAAGCRTARLTTEVVYAEDLAPESIAERLEELGRRSDAIALIAADHPLISQTIFELKQKGVPVVTYITDLSAPERAGHVGTDNWKLGRTAAWFIAETTQGPGRVALFIGNHRYQCQDISDASFRSYIREHAPRLVVEDSRPTGEDPTVAYHMVKDLLEEPDGLKGIYIAGGGISGVLQALREVPPVQRGKVRVVCRDPGPETRKGLTEGLITAALSHPLEQTSPRLIQTMIQAIDGVAGSSSIQCTLPFEIITPENV